MKSEAFANLCLRFEMFLCWFSVVRRAGCQFSSKGPPGNSFGDPPLGDPPWSLPSGISSPWLWPGSRSSSGFPLVMLELSTFGFFPLARVDSPLVVVLHRAYVLGHPLDGLLFVLPSFWTLGSTLVWVLFYFLLVSTLLVWATGEFPDVRVQGLGLLRFLGFSLGGFWIWIQICSFSRG